MKTHALKDIIKLQRKARKKRQKDVAEIIGVSQQAVGKWEKGEAPGMAHVPALSAFLGIDEDEIVQMIDKIKAEASFNTQTGTGNVISSGESLSPAKRYLIELIDKHGGDSLVDELIAIIINKK